MKKAILSILAVPLVATAVWAGHAGSERPYDQSYSWSGTVGTTAVNKDPGAPHGVKCRVTIINYDSSELYIGLGTVATAAGLYFNENMGLVETFDVSDTVSLIRGGSDSGPAGIRVEWKGA